MNTPNPRQPTIIVAALLMLIILSFSCGTINQSMRQENRRIEKSKKDIGSRKDEREKVYQKQTERQKKIQTKETRKQMKELEKKSKRWRDNKKEPFYETWFHNWRDNRDRKRQSRKD